MAAECKVCLDARVADINRALDEGQSTNGVAKAFGFARTTMQRHAAHRGNPETTTPAPPTSRSPAPPSCTPASSPAPSVEIVLPGPDARRDAEPTIRELAEEAKKLVTDAGLAGSFRERATCLSAAARVLELLARITGELSADIEIRILELPEWAALQDVMFRALEPFPEARVAVEQALRGMHGAPARLPR